MKKHIIIGLLLGWGKSQAAPIDLSTLDDENKPVLWEISNTWCKYIQPACLPSVKNRNGIKAAVQAVQSFSFKIKEDTYTVPTDTSFILYITLGNTSLKFFSLIPDIMLPKGLKFKDSTDEQQRPFKTVLRDFISLSSINREKADNIDLTSVPEDRWLETYELTPNK